MASQPTNQTDPMSLEITCAAQKPLLAILRRFVCNVAEEFGFADEDLVKIEMAVDEACTNALVHAIPPELPREQHGLELKVLIESDTLTFQIRDHGAQPVPGCYAGAGTIDEYAHPERKDGYRGLGILIMKEFMDEVQFTAFPDTGTMVTLRKHLKGCGG